MTAVTGDAKPGWRTLFLAWLGLFAGIACLLWAAIEFWGRDLRLGVSPGTAAVRRTEGRRVLPPLNNAPVMRLDEVTESNARLTFAGRMVEFDSVRVTEVGPLTFRVASDGGGTILVASAHRKSPDVRVGDRVNLHGLIYNVPGAEALQKVWKLDAAQAAAAEREQVYLRASTIEKL
jgi:hypothetical protein